MLDVTKSLPEDPAELRAFTALLLAEVKSQAVLIQKLQHQLAPLGDASIACRQRATAPIGSGHRPRRPTSCNWPWRYPRSLSPR